MKMRPAENLNVRRVTTVKSSFCQTNTALPNFPVSRDTMVRRTQITWASQWTFVLALSKTDGAELSRSTEQQTHRLVFDGGAGDAQVQLAVLLNAGINQGLNGALVLEQQERISWQKVGRADYWRHTSSPCCRARMLAGYIRLDWLQLTFRWKIGLALCLVGPVDKQVTETAETGSDFIWKAGRWIIKKHLALESKLHVRILDMITNIQHFIYI